MKSLFLVIFFILCHGETDPRSALSLNENFELVRYERASCSIESCFDSIISYYVDLVESTTDQSILDLKYKIYSLDDLWFKCVNQRIPKDIPREHALAVCMYSADCTILSNQLQSGEAGVWNCFLEHMFEGLKILRQRSTGIPSTLWSGVDPDSAKRYKMIEGNSLTLTVDQKIVVSGFFSTSASSRSATEFSWKYYTKDPRILFEITSLTDSPTTDIACVSVFPTESEYLYPTQVAFKVDSIEAKCCIVNLYDCIPATLCPEGTTCPEDSTCPEDTNYLFKLTRKKSFTLQKKEKTQMKKTTYCAVLNSQRNL